MGLHGPDGQHPVGHHDLGVEQDPGAAESRAQKNHAPFLPAVVEKDFFPEFRSEGAENSFEVFETTRPVRAGGHQDLEI
jgi:hypothetical protein